MIELEAARRARLVVDAARQRAAAWAGGGGEGTVEVLGVDRRTFAELHHLRVSAGGPARDVVVKVALAGPRTRPDSESRPRPRLVPLVEPGRRSALERQALRLLERHFVALGDARFRAVTVVDELVDPDAVVLERIDRPSLRDLTVRAAVRGRSREPELVAAYANAGAWLRQYHRLRPEHASTVLRPDRAAFVEAVEQWCAFLGETTGDPGHFTSIARRAGRAAAVHLPPSLPLGLRHDDFAPRNVLVGAGGQVTVLDVLAQWEAPVYESVAHFVMTIGGDVLSVATRGLVPPPSARAGLERAFLGGYFDGDDVPWGAVRMVELLMVLDRWTAWAVDGRGDEAVTRRLAGMLRRGVGTGPLRRRVSALLDELERG